jgi:two-component system, OmpR family, sensor histidine kinase CiaH
LNFKRALVKLTLGYLVLIMLACGILSVVLYAVGSQPLERRLDLRQRILREEIPPPPEMFRRLDPLAVDEVKQHLAMFLVYFNIGVFCIAGVLSYSLAKRELKPLEAAMELQNRFTSDAAHELRTPLTAMKAEIEVALRGGDLKDDDTRELLQSNLEEIGKLETLSAGLLKLAQYEEGATLAGAGAVELGEMINESVDRVRRLAEPRGIKLSLEVVEATVPGDRNSLVEMLVILLDNGIKYSDDDTTITVSTELQRRHVVITVADEGYGIDREDVAHVFDRLYRGKLPASRQVEGYGLGLSIAKRIAEMHRGTIRIQSAPGEGTTVTVELPLAHEKDKSEARRAGEARLEGEVQREAAGEGGLETPGETGAEATDKTPPETPSPE